MMVVGYWPSNLLIGQQLNFAAARASILAHATRAARVHPARSFSTNPRRPLVCLPSPYWDAPCPNPKLLIIDF